MIFIALPEPLWRNTGCQCAVDYLAIDADPAACQEVMSILAFYRAARKLAEVIESAKP